MHNCRRCIPYAHKKWLLIPPGQGTTIQATQLFSYINNNKLVKEGQVIIVFDDHSEKWVDIGATRVEVQVPGAGASYVPCQLDPLRRGNLDVLTGCGLDLVQTFDSMTQSLRVGDLPWNQIYSLLAVLTVEFHHPSSQEVVSAVHQRADSKLARWGQGQWSTVTEMALMCGYFKIDHPGGVFIRPSQYDLKLGALHILRIFESLLDMADMNDDIVNIGVLIMNCADFHVRIKHFTSFVAAQGIDIKLDANRGLPPLAIPHYRWLPPHCYRLKDTRCGELDLEGFNIDWSVQSWYRGHYVNLDNVTSCSFGLNLLRLRINDGECRKDMINTYDRSQVVTDLGQVWSYRQFLNLFLERQTEVQDICIPPPARIRNFRTKSIDVVVIPTFLRSIFYGVFQEKRFDVIDCEPETDWMLMGPLPDADNPDYYDDFSLANESRNGEGGVAASCLEKRGY